MSGSFPPQPLSIREPGSHQTIDGQIMVWMTDWRVELSLVWGWFQCVYIYIYVCVCVCVSVYIVVSSNLHHGSAQVHALAREGGLLAR